MAGEIIMWTVLVECLLALLVSVETHYQNQASRRAYLRARRRR